MPYLDIALVRRLFHKAERIRTCNSVLLGHNSGMFAAVNNITNPKSSQIDGYISYAGIPSISHRRDQKVDVVTPYAVSPT